jgi:hypothetical protein
MSKDRDQLKKIFKKANQKVTRAVAEEIVEAIALDGVYSTDEKDYIQSRRDNDDLVYTRGTEKFLGRLLSNLPLRFHREAVSAAAEKAQLEKLDSQIMGIVGSEGEIGTEQTDAVFALIEANGYTEAYRFTVQFLYDGDRLTDEAKKSLKSKIASNRVSGAHRAWVSKKADTALAELFGGSFQGAKVDMAKAQQILDILFTDFQYSEQEKETMANLYRNGDFTEGTKEYIQDEIFRFTNGMTLDGQIVDCFASAIKLVDNGDSWIVEDGVVDASEADIIIELAGIGKGMSDNAVRTIQYCLQTFNATELAEDKIEAALAGDAEKKAEKVAEKTEKVTKAAEKAESVKEEETATEITPSKTLMAAYNELKNKRGKITANSADDFVAAITKDHKYTKNEQATMRILRNAEAFTAAGYREVLLGIRRFIASKNFAK